MENKKDKKNEIKFSSAHPMIRQMFQDYDIKEITSSTDGNPGAQIKKLDELGYVELEKAFVNNKPQTTCDITAFGREQFKEYVEMLEKTSKTIKLTVMSRRMLLIIHSRLKNICTLR